VISYFLHLAAENSARWQYRQAWWYVFFMAILGGWGPDRLPFRRQLKRVATTQCTFINPPRFELKQNLLQIFLSARCNLQQKKRK
jgi:hypothetical protein